MNNSHNSLTPLTDAALKEVLSSGGELHWGDHKARSLAGKMAALERELAEKEQAIFQLMCGKYGQKDLTEQLAEKKRELEDAKRKIGSLKLKNLTNAVARICQTCGHEKTDDGCAFCITSNHSEERTTFRAIAKLFNIDLDNSSPNQAFEQFQQVAQSNDSLKSLCGELVKALKFVEGNAVFPLSLIPQRPWEIVNKALTAAKEQGIGAS